MYSADDIINAAEKLCKEKYEGEPAQFRLAYQVGFLKGWIQELCTILNHQVAEIEQLRHDLTAEAK
jgi:hypothetical protein